MMGGKDGSDTALPAGAADGVLAATGAIMGFSHWKKDPPS
jgi:hypothetical protein